MKNFFMMAALIALPMGSKADTQLDDIFLQWSADPTRIFNSSEVSLDDLHWQLRALVVFGDGVNDPRYLEQMELIEKRMDDFVERDVIIIVDVDPDVLSDLRRELRPRSFTVVLVGKDGSVAFRHPSPRDAREISRSIDKMPLRQQEIANRRTGE